MIDETAKARRGVAGRIAPDRVPPHSDEAEISVLGGMLLEEAAVDRAMELLTEDDFYHPAHRHIFRAISNLRDLGHAPDALAVREELRRRDLLEESGGDDYLARIVEIVPTAANLPYHARIVLDSAVKRRLIAAGTEIVSAAYEASEEADHLLNRAEEKMFRLGERRFKKAFTPINQLLQGAVMQLESLSARKESITGAPSGFKDLDDLTAGFQLSDLIIVAGRPSMGKCVAWDSEIVLADGRVLPIEEVCRRREGEVLSLRSDWTLGPAPVSRFVDDGLKPVFEVRTRLGRRVRTTLPHPFLTIDGWRPLGELAPGARVAVPRRIPTFGDRAMRECEIKLLAYLIGDGCLRGASPTFTNGNERLLREVAGAVDRFGGATTRRVKPAGIRTPALRIVADPQSVSRRRREFAVRLAGRLDADGRSARSIAREIDVSPATITYWRQGLCAPGAGHFTALCAALGVEENDLAPEGRGSIARSAPGPVTAWLARQGLQGKGARDKRVPEAVFTLPREQLALFLNRLFATDGWASVLASGQAQVGYASCSERLSRQVQHLLLRFGVVAALKRREVRYRDGHRVAWQLDVTHRDSLESFVAEIGIFGKETAIECVRDALEGRRRQVNRDVIPAAGWERIERALDGRPWSDLARLLGKQRGHNLHVGTRGLSRDRLEEIAVAVADEELMRLARSDVWWDEIISIEPVGMQQVYDLTVEGWHNFVSDDICVHNTSFSLNIAAHAAIVEDLPVAIFSLEMSMEQLVQRLISTEALVSLKTLRTGQASSEQWKNVADACDRLRRAAIYIDDSSMLSALEMRAKARRLKQQRDIGLVVVDYLQLMESGSRAENRQQEITEISRSLKALAKELNIPVIALSQLSRAPEHRGDARPKLADLRESG
ncbi:MAG TPA: replicative DNA helicase, partial [Gemmatimonadota bacterium]|nr:replicative DNA helicase [Gemmatimonadota bacterium]